MANLVRSLWNLPFCELAVLVVLMSTGCALQFWCDQWITIGCNALESSRFGQAVDRKEQEAYERDLRRANAHRKPVHAATDSGSELNSSSQRTSGTSRRNIITTAMRPTNYD
jgi:hypothetical protein